MTALVVRLRRPTGAFISPRFFKLVNMEHPREAGELLAKEQKRREKKAAKAEDAELFDEVDADQEEEPADG